MRLLTGQASIRDVLLFPQMRALQTSRGQEVWRVSEPKGIFLGLDPGGKGHFGWSICRNESDKLAVVKTDLADNAVEAIKAVNRTMSDENLPKGTVLSAGIDAPLFWSKTGFREIDVTIRNAVKEARCPKPAGTVQAINSLRGACLVVSQPSFNSFTLAGKKSSSGVGHGITAGRPPISGLTDC